MNGVRSTFMRRGYLLTALSALLLLVASAGTAEAQVTVTAPATVDEAGSVTIDVSATVRIPPETAPGSTIVVSPTVAPGAGNLAQGGATTPGEEADSLGFTPGSVELRVPRNDAPNAVAITRTLTGSMVWRTDVDTDAEDEAISLTFTVQNDDSLTGADGNTVIGNPARPHSITINDSETQVVELVPPTRATEGSNFTVTFRARPAPVNMSYEAALAVDSLGYSVSPASATLNSGTDSTPLTVTPPNSDGNRVGDTVVLSATRAGTTIKLVPDLSIPVADIHALPAGDAITAKAYESVGVNNSKGTDEAMSVTEGGAPVHVTVTVDRGATGYPSDEALEVTLAAADGRQDVDYRVTPAKVTVPAGTGKVAAGDFMLWARQDDDDVAKDEKLVLNITATGATKTNGTGESVGSFEITIEDATVPKVAPKSADDAYSFITDPMEEAAGDDGLNPSESFMVKMSDLFELTEGYDATYDASTEGSAVSVSETGDTVTITAEEAGTSKVTVTATAGAAASSFAPSQTVSNVAQVAFEVTVVDKELVVTLAADPMEIDEGDMSTITATANRAVVANDGDVVINLTATGGELDSETITIAMGEMGGTAMLTAAADDDTNDATVTIVASGSGIEGNATLEIAVNDTTETPEPTNAIEAKPEDEAYPIITGAIDAGAGEEGLNPGESATIDAAELFTVMEGYTASYAADVDGDAASASVSGSHVTVMADGLGEAKVTITGTATAASSSFQAGQPAANVATVTFAVMVVDKGLTIELHGPDNVMSGNLVEGSEYHLTVKANRVVREDTMVSFTQRGGAENAASAADYELNDVTLLAGSDSVRATLSIVEDMEADAGHAMGEQLIIYAMAGDAESDDLMFTIWDEAVPALPLIAQLLLALFLMAGGARLYRRRQS